MRFRAPVLGLALLVSLGAAADSARKIPGITVKDVFPRGCVDCHTAKAGQPATIASLLSDPKAVSKIQQFVPKNYALKGKHPPVTALKDVPGACIKCHAAMSKVAPPFAPMIHGMHLTGGDANTFLTKFDGECTHCHKFDATTAVWSMPK
ncbi:MAG: hypothetical protein ACXVJT_19030 [Thermoanaerobaculia bacterium]